MKDTHISRTVRKGPQQSESRTQQNKSARAFLRFAFLSKNWQRLSEIYRHTATGCDEISPFKHAGYNKYKAPLSVDSSLVYSRTMQGEMGAKHKQEGVEINQNVPVHLASHGGGHSDNPMLCNVAVRWKPRVSSRVVWKRADAALYFTHTHTKTS